MKDFSSAYDSNGRLAKIKFRATSTISSGTIVAKGLLHGSSAYLSACRYYNKNNALVTDTILDVTDSGTLFPNNSSIQPTGDNYIEFIYPYYS